MSLLPKPLLVSLIVGLAACQCVEAWGAEARHEESGSPEKASPAKRGEANAVESRRGEAKAAAREDAKAADADDTGGRSNGRRIDGISRKSKDLKTSDEAIEQLSTRIAEKLAAMKAEAAAKSAPPPHLIVKNQASSVRVAYSIANSPPGTLPAPGAHGAPAATPQSPAAALAAAHRKSQAEASGKAGAHAAQSPGALPGHVAHWTYSGDTGPENWSKLNPDFAKCTNGARQSPINIREGIKVDLEPIQFDYQPSAFRVLDNGHTIQVGIAPGNAIQVLGRRYELVQFHFHRPAEERVNGRVFEMVAHMVHKDAEGHLAVVAVLIERGITQPVIQTVWNNLPLEQGEELAAPVKLDPGQLLPQERAYFTFMGSLTTPPCSEGVLWMVLKQPVQVSNEQLAIFARLYPMNARPLQALSGRLIKESN